MQKAKIIAGGLLLAACFLSAGAGRSIVHAQPAPEAVVYVDRAVVAYGEKRFDDALKELEEALRLNPESVDALYYQALVHLALGRGSEAQTALEKALQLRPNDPDLAFQLGVVYFNQEAYDKAESLLRQAYRANPRRPNVGYYLGFIEFRKQNYRAALGLFESSVPLDDNFAQLTRFYSSLALSALGFAGEAKAAVDEALRLQPASPLTAPAQRFGELLERAARQEKNFRGELRLGVFYDTNVPVVPNASSDILGQALREEADRRKSEGELASLSLAYAWLRKPAWEGTVSYRFFQTYNNHLTKFNTQSHTPTFGLAYRGTVGEFPAKVADYVTGVQLAYDFITLGNARFTQRWIVNPYFTLIENRNNVTTLHFRFQVKDFFNDNKVAKEEVRDALNYAVGPLHFFVFDEWRHYVKLGYQFDLDDADGRNWGYRGHRLVAGGQYTVPAVGVRLRYDLDFHWRDHDHKHSFIPVTGPGTKKRRDQELVQGVGVAKDFLLDFSKSLPFTGCELKNPRCSFTVSLDYLFDKNLSNLKPFDYDRHVITTSVAWRF